MCEYYVILQNSFGANALGASSTLRTRFFQRPSIINLFSLNTAYFLVISFVLLFSTDRATNRERIIYFVLAVTIINDWI
jgi:hypothetical protein